MNTPDLKELRWNLCRAYPSLSEVDVFSASSFELNEGLTRLLENRNIRDVVKASYGSEFLNALCRQYDIEPQEINHD